MNTPAHLIFAATAFGQPARKHSLWVAMAGGLAPDLSLYLMAGVSLYVLGLSPSYVFDTLYFTDAWQQVFKIDNSFVIWGAVLALAWWRRWPLLMIFAASALLHIGLDFPLHHDDGRAHFWPLSDWVFESPVSYWDTRHHAGVVAPIEMGLCVVFGIILLRRFTGLYTRVLILALLALQVAPVVFWAFVFAQ